MINMKPAATGVMYSYQSLTQKSLPARSVIFYLENIGLFILPFEMCLNRQKFRVVRERKHL